MREQKNSNIVSFEKFLDRVNSFHEFSTQGMGHEESKLWYGEHLKYVLELYHKEGKTICREWISGTDGKVRRAYM